MQIRRFIAGVGSLLVLVVLLVGIPTALILLAGNPIPSLHALEGLLTTPDYAGGFLIHTVLPVIAWVAWVSFAVGFFVQLPATIRGIEPPTFGPLRLQRQGAAVLIGAILVMFAGGSLTMPAEAHAETPSASVSSSQQTTAAPTATHDETAAASSTTARTADPSLPTYTVQQGDSLWRIAEQHLGDGKRYTEIAQLNYGVQQADGTALSADHWLKPGWVLTLPADATSTAGTSHTVAAGETLWGIAQQTLGNGDRYMDLFTANQGKMQADGTALTDPTVLRPGWVLTIPEAASSTTTSSSTTAAPSTSPAGASSSAAAPSDDGQENAAAKKDNATAKASPAPTATATPSPSASGGSTEDDSAEVQGRHQHASEHSGGQHADESASLVDEIPWRTAGGIGGVLAAGLLSGLAARRMRQRRNRKPGERISLPAEDITPMELELRTVENPFGVDDVDRALRLLAVWAQDTGATLPQLYAIRLAEAEIALYLDEPADLPEPFVAVSEDKQAWIVEPEGIEDLDRIPTAPYPALVAIGHDSTQAQILVDLEHIGSLNLDGDPDLARQALTAIAIELAQSTWADDLTVTLVGVAEDIPAALGTSRIRHVDDTDTLLRNLRGQAADAERAMHDLGVDSIEKARSIGQTDAWTPEIVILGQMPEQSVQDELAELVTRLPRVGIASVSHGHLVGDWVLRLADGDTATLEPIGLPLTPQTVSDEEYQQIVRLLSAAEQPAVAGPAWAESVSRDEVTIDDLPVDSPVHLVDEDVDSTTTGERFDPEVAWRQELHEALPPATAELAAATAAEDAPAPAPTTAEEPFTHPALTRLQHGPYVQVLGSVQVHGARGKEPQTNGNSNVVPATELIAYLALHQGANTLEEVSKALWPKKPVTGPQAEQRRNRLMSQARNWLGNDDSGDLYIPKVPGVGYRVDGVPTDYAVFLELVGDDISSTPTQNLVAALDLVKAAPFDALKRGRYLWEDLETLRAEMIATIGDVTHEVAARALKAGNFAHARVAAAVGRQVDPVNELFWRDAILAEYQAGDQAGVDRIWTQLTEYLDGFADGYEPDDETLELIQQIRDHQTQGAA